MNSILKKNPPQIPCKSYKWPFYPENPPCNPANPEKDNDGESYLDFTAGIAVNCLGHSDEGWAETVAKQAGKLCHTSNLYLRLGDFKARLF